MIPLSDRDRIIARRLSDEFRSIPDGGAIDRVLKLLEVHWPELSPTERVSLARALLPVLKPLMDANAEITAEMRLRCLEAVRMSLAGRSP